MFFDKNIRYAHRSEYQICTKCVMDTTASEITFDESGICNFCHGVNSHIGNTWFPNNSGEKILKSKFEEILNYKSNEKYDCLIGISGGIDSSVVACKAKQAGLSPLLLHIDAGWNTNTSVSNVEKLTNFLKLDLHTIVVDWDEMRQLQLAYLKSNVMNQDTPQDHALFSSFYNFAYTNKFKYLISGVNFASESVEPASWGYTYTDGKQIKYIAKKFSNLKLKKYPILRIKEYKKIIKNSYFEIVRPLDFGLYNPIAWKNFLVKRIGWTPYDSKHGESFFTNFFQNIYLYEKFNIDKRRSHLSSLIINKTLHRESVLKELNTPPIGKDVRNRLLRSVASKLEISESELESFLYSQARDHYALPNDSKKI